MFTNKSGIEIALCDIIHSKRQFLVFRILIIVMITEISRFLRRDDTFHKLYSRIILTRIAASFRPYHHLFELTGVGL